MNTNFLVIGLTQLGMKPESTTPEASLLTTRPSELLMMQPWLHFSSLNYFNPRLLCPDLLPVLNRKVMV